MWMITYVKRNRYYTNNIPTRILQMSQNGIVVNNIPRMVLKYTKNTDLCFIEVNNSNLDQSINLEINEFINLIRENTIGIIGEDIFYFNELDNFSKRALIENGIKCLVSEKFLIKFDNTHVLQVNEKSDSPMISIKQLLVFVSECSKFLIV